jgi:hypothetical protein
MRMLCMLDTPALLSLLPSKCACFCGMRMPCRWTRLEIGSVAPLVHELDLLVTP